MTRAQKIALKDLHREVNALQDALRGKRPPHGEQVGDERGYYVRTKWPSNFSRADRALQAQFNELKTLKRTISAVMRGDLSEIDQIIEREEALWQGTLAS
jgi:hypothetical protein